MVMIKYRLLYACVMITVLVAPSCTKRSAPSKTIENFDVFYTKFHEDLSFQLERVRFPLEGHYIDVEGDQAWDKAQWEMHRQKVTDITEPDYDTEIIKEEDAVTDRVKIRDSGFYTERRFELQNGKWYLVYYESVNL